MRGAGCRTAIALVYSNLQLRIRPQMLKRKPRARFSVQSLNVEKHARAAAGYQSNNWLHSRSYFSCSFRDTEDASRLWEHLSKAINDAELRHLVQLDETRLFWQKRCRDPKPFSNPLRSSSCSGREYIFYEYEENAEDCWFYSQN